MTRDGTLRWGALSRGRRHTPALEGPVAASLRKLAAKAHPLETGGLLLGWWEGNALAIVDCVEVPDPHAGRSSWLRREKVAQQALSRVLADRDDPHLGYVGDWHSHPADVGASRPDLRELRRVSRQYERQVALAVVRYGGRVDLSFALAGRLLPSSPRPTQFKFPATTS